jgi:hypothetical protein
VTSCNGETKTAKPCGANADPSGKHRGAAVTYFPWNNGSVAVSTPQDAKDLGSGINCITGGAYRPDLSLTNFIRGSGGPASITNNQLGGGYGYDAAGNMTCDPTPGHQLTCT